MWAKISLELPGIFVREPGCACDRYGVSHPAQDLMITERNPVRLTPDKESGTVAFKTSFNAEVIETLVVPLPKFENISEGSQVTVFDGFTGYSSDNVVEGVVDNETRILRLLRADS